MPCRGDIPMREDAAIDDADARRAINSPLCVVEAIDVIGPNIRQRMGLPACFISWASVRAKWLGRNETTQSTGCGAARSDG